MNFYRIRHQCPQCNYKEITRELLGAKNYREEKGCKNCLKNYNEYVVMDNI